MNSISDHLHHAQRIICRCRDHTRRTVSQRIHGIVQMGYMMSTLFHGFCGAIIIRTCMAYGNHHIIFKRFNKLLCVFHIRSHSHNLYPSTGSVLTFPEKFNVRFADVFLHMCPLFRRIQKRSFHIQAHNPGAALILLHFCCGSKNPDQLIHGKCHRCRTVGSNSVNFFILENFFQAGRICV